jgi:hypothetical protein
MGEGIFDKVSRIAKEQATEHPEQVDGAIDKLGDLVDKATGGKYSEQIDSAEDKVSDAVRSKFGDDQPGA